MTQPNFSSNPRRISSGSEAPPEMQVRSVAVWAGGGSYLVVRERGRTGLKERGQQAE
ncbi:MAG TPA: hypothetical protein VFO01_00620 [Trebonia sp.]|nr:hypothetical protein [Trebonia sp.]